MPYDRMTLNIKLAEQRTIERMVEKSKEAGETDRYADLTRQLNRVKNEVSAILTSRKG